jgi:predicted Zn-dependent peptidase
VTYAGVDPSKAEETLSALLAELVRLRDEDVPEDELERAKSMMKGRLLLRMEDTRAVSDWIGAQEMLTNRVRDVEDISALVDEVTAADLRAAAQRLFVQDQLNLAVVGPFRSTKVFRELLTL